MQRPQPKVFVSSTWLDLLPEREAVEAAIHRMRDSDFNGMEYFGSRDDTPREVSLAEVDRSHVYVGIFAARYGSGITEEEYRRARERGLICHIYFKAEASITLDKVEKGRAQQARLKKLKAELAKAHIVTPFTSPDDLATKVLADLHRWLAEEYQPQPTVATPAEATAALALAALHQLPPPPGDFTGRAAELAELTANIERGVNISGLQGQGGIGKTALALKLAEQLAPHYPDAQFYLDLKGASKQPLAATDALAHVIRAYHPDAKLPDNEAALRGLYQSVLHGQRALLLMDNAAAAAQVAPLIPPVSCVLLVTSRQHFTLPGLHPIDLDTLPVEDARKLLLTIAPRTGTQADELAKLCGYLPLALRLAASAIAERADLGVADYVRRLTDARQRLNLIEASLGLSYDLLSTELQQRWRTLAVFPVTFDAAAAAVVWATELDAAQDALGELVKYSLLTWNDPIARYSMHDLARLFADSRMSADERNTGQARHAIHYADVLTAANALYMQGGEAIMRGLALFDAEWTNIQAGQSWAARHASDNDTNARLCARYPSVGAYVLHLRQHPLERVNWLQQALAAARKANDRLGERSALGNLGLAYANLGEPRRAIELFEQALEITHEIGDRRVEGSLLNNLGGAYKALGEPRRAIEYCEQHLIIAREIGDRRGEGSTLVNLGLVYKTMGELRRAMEFYEQALVILREIGDRRTEGTDLWNMSLVLDELGDRVQAIAHAEAALKIREQIDDPNAAKVREQLAEWRGQGE
ncbi:MAG: tetratricopeptide repeat protein [Pyrinomonadaceae bacterium]